MPEFAPKIPNLEPFIVPRYDDIEALRLLPAREFLNGHVNSFLIEGAAELAHNSWRLIKTDALENSDSPYRGWGPTRLKVGQLSTDEKLKLGIATDANPAADVYHPLDLPYIELDEATRGKNIIPMVALCNGLGDIFLGGDATISDLKDALKSFVDGTNDDLNELLSRIHHIAFVAGEVRAGSRPYGDTYRDGFPLYENLDKPVQALDREVLVPVAEFLLAKLNPDHVNWNTFIGEAIFSSNRRLNIRFPLIASILAVSGGYKKHENGVLVEDRIYFSDDASKNFINFDFIDETRMVSRDYTLYGSDFSQDEVVEIRDELLAAGLIYIAADGTWRRVPDTGKELDAEIKRLRSISK